MSRAKWTGTDLDTPAKRSCTLYNRILLTQGGANRVVAVLAVLLLGTILLATATGGFTVTLDANGGDAVACVHCRHGEDLSPLPVPQRAGYRFTGWYTDRTCTKRWRSGDTVTASLTLYAGWEPIDEAEPPNAIASDHAGRLLSVTHRFLNSFQADPSAAMAISPAACCASADK